MQLNFEGVRYGFVGGIGEDPTFRMSHVLRACLLLSVSRASFCSLVSRQRYCSFYDVTCHMTLQHVCVCHSVRAFQCACASLCILCRPLAAIAGRQLCASLCAKYIWSVSYFEFKLKNFLASLLRFCVACVRDKWHIDTHIVFAALPSNNKNYLYI